VITVRYHGPSKGSVRLEAFFHSRGVPVAQRELVETAEATPGRVDLESELFVDVALRIEPPSGLGQDDAVRILESIASDFKRTVGFPTRVEISPDHR
jgi:hypothetical protein